MKKAKISNPGRRRFLNKSLFGGAALGAVGVGVAYSLNRGIRFPTLGLEPRPLATEFSFSNGAISATSSDFIHVKDTPNSSVSLRAFSAQPKLNLASVETTRLSLSIHNISPDAELISSSDTHVISESTDGISRAVTVELKANQELNLQWHLPYQNNFTFASIGDSGGDQELAWCIKRAHALGAKFLLHLGDFNYQEGDYKRSIELFNNSPIPCFISIGNHDFHDSGIIYPQFLNQLGPLNHAFTIGKTRFVNIDTAANMFPYSAGKRGKLLSALEQHNDSVVDTVSFTHCPLHDPLQGSHHDIGSIGERDWLIGALNRIQSKTLLSGHIHIYHRSEFMGIDNIIAGQGLGHQDILTNSDYSKMVLGDVAADGKVSFRTEPLSMPMRLHCHPRSQSARDLLMQPGMDTPEHKALHDLLIKECGRKAFKT